MVFARLFLSPVSSILANTPAPPFVLLSGAIGESAAVAAIKMGVSDYLAKDDVAKLREELPTRYVSKDDFSDRWNEVLQALHRIENKIDQKADK